MCGAFRRNQFGNRVIASDLAQPGFRRNSPRVSAPRRSAPRLPRATLRRCGAGSRGRGRSDPHRGPGGPDAEPLGVHPHACVYAGSKTCTLSQRDRSAIVLFSVPWPQSLHNMTNAMTGLKSSYEITSGLLEMLGKQRFLPSRNRLRPPKRWPCANGWRIVTIDTGIPARDHLLPAALRRPDGDQSTRRW